MPLDLVIFDCDGVLVDSEIIAAEVESELLADAGYTIEPLALAERFSGMTWKDILIEIEREAGIPLSATLIDKSEKLLDQRLARDVRAIAGAAEALAALSGPRCICSNSTDERLAMMLRKTGLKSLFGAHVYSAKSVGEGLPKPAPDVFLHAAGVFKAAPRRTIVIEDSVHGVHGAVTAGMRVIGFTGASHSTAGHADRLTDAGAETVIARMADLPATLEALAAWDGMV